jgi:hypothetical protein
MLHSPVEKTKTDKVNWQYLPKKDKKEKKRKRAE